MKHIYLLITALPNRKIINADCTTSYVLNYGVTELNLTKFLQDVQKWLLITLLNSKLQSSDPLWNVNVTNEDLTKMLLNV